MKPSSKPALKRSPKQHRLTVGAADIDYELIYSKRKTLGIHVYPDGRVVVRAPLNADFAQIETHLRGRAAWILKHQRAFKAAPTSAPPVPRQYVTGEMFRYLGSSYRLQVIEQRLERVQIDGDTLIASVRDPQNRARIEALITRWYRLQAERVFAERLTALYPKMQPLGVKAIPPLKIRDMKTRWGSCSSNGNVALNLKLIHVPLDLIDYVVLHELCHLLELNHSPAFWKLMDRVLPDWKARRKRLNQTPI